MKARLKKIVSLLMAIFLFTLMFYSCGKGSVKNTTISTVTTASTETTANTTTPPVNTTVDHVKEYDENEYMRQLQNLKYGEVPEYLKQIGVPSDEDMEFIREKLEDRYYIISDPAQAWEDKIRKMNYLSAYVGTFNIGDGESIVYFQGLSSFDTVGTVSPSIAYYKKSGKIQLTMRHPRELEEYEELFLLRFGEYDAYFGMVVYIINSRKEK